MTAPLLPEIRIHNTMTQQKAPLVPLTPGQVGIYVCGPTVYSFIHIGNARTFTSFDVVVRYLRFRNFKVNYVRNFTDVDDKIINAAKLTGEAPVELAARFVREFESDAKALHLIAPDVSPKVSETIPEIVAIIAKLIENGVAYPSNGDVYFEVKKHKDYLKLSHRNLDDLQAGARVEVDETKRYSADFALWKGAKPGEPFWPSPWGNGRPGWHIECSAMSKKYLGETFDLHGGGLDLIFPHHENEIAQSEGASLKPLCTYWMHCGFLDLEGAKMSKSLGNVVRLRDALEKVDAEALRSFLLSTHYRQALAFGDKALADAETRMEYFYESLRKLDEKLAGKDFSSGPVHGTPEKFISDFHEAMSDDFNVPNAMGVLAGLFTEINLLCDKPPSKDKVLMANTLGVLRNQVKDISQVLGIFESTPVEWLARRKERLIVQKNINSALVEEKIAARAQARKDKNFALGDSLRAELKSMGIEILDSPTGTTWKVLSE
jgi:cysteinyl-tRNA synthetase